jgi:hypothetical protein
MADSTSFLFAEWQDNHCVDCGSNDTANHAYSQYGPRLITKVWQVYALMYALRFLNINVVEVIKHIFPPRMARQYP